MATPYLLAPKMATAAPTELLISNLAWVGEVGPIPILTSEVEPLTPLTDPSTMQFLQSDREKAPIAVELRRLLLPMSALKPRPVLKAELVLAYWLNRARYPMAVLPAPIVSENKAW